MPSSSRFWMMASPISSSQLVGDRHVELPEQVVVEVGRLGEGVLDGRHLRDLGGARAPLVAVVEVVLEELLDVDLLQGVVALRLVLGLLLRRSRPRTASPGRDLLEQRVLHHLLLEDLGQLEGGEGQELDGLLERRGEDQPLGEAGAEGPASVGWPQDLCLRSRVGCHGAGVARRAGSASPR